MKNSLDWLNRFEQAEESVKQDNYQVRGAEEKKNEEKSVEPEQLLGYRHYRILHESTYPRNTMKFEQNQFKIHIKTHYNQNSEAKERILKV